MGENSSGGGGSRGEVEGEILAPMELLKKRFQYMYYEGAKIQNTELLNFVKKS